MFCTFARVVRHRLDHFEIHHHGNDPAFAFLILDQRDAARHESDHLRVGSQHLCGSQAVAEVEYLYALRRLAGQRFYFLVQLVDPDELEVVLVGAQLERFHCVVETDTVLNLDTRDLQFDIGIADARRLIGSECEFAELIAKSNAAII